MPLTSEDGGIRWVKSKPKNLPEEKVFYQQGLVRITDQVATFGTERYSIWALTAARMRTKLAENWVSLFMIITSALITGEGWDDGIGSAFDDGIKWSYVILGVFVAGFALYLNERSKPSFVIQLDLPSGEIPAYTCQNEEESAKIVDAINTAISQRE
jgi:hypothetical protein